MTRRLLLCALFAGVSISSTGCCGRVRSFVYRITHCPPGVCHPPFAYGPGPVFPRAAIGYADDGFVAPSYSGPIHDGMGSGAPGCSTCMSGGASIPAVPTVGYSGPVFTGPITHPSAPMGSTGPVQVPMQMTPPSVTDPGKPMSK